MGNGVSVVDTDNEYDSDVTTPRNRNAGGPGRGPAGSNGNRASRTPVWHMARDEIAGLSVKEIKERLLLPREAGGGAATLTEIQGCVEKTELVDLLFEKLGGGSDTCAICFSDDIKGIHMPCCGTPGSSMVYCRRCLEVIIDMNQGQGAGGSSGIGRIGNCPTCKKHYQFDKNTGEVTNAVVQRQCGVCLQHKVIKSFVGGGRPVCEQCHLGRSYCFRYECKRCQHVQRIPHPMWTYQPAPTEFGTVTWACHNRQSGGCARDLGDNAFTTWRITTEDAAQVPPQYAPESWGGREEWLAKIREIRQQETETRALVLAQRRRVGSRMTATY